MTPVPADEDARRRIREDLDTTFVVEAAAGTGKTTALVSRIVATVRAGRANLDTIAAVTFTEKAAGEMKLRLREALERARSSEAAGTGRRRRLDEALAALEAARIATIHSFCADLLRERPLEAGIDPDFEVLPEDEAERLLDRAFDGWFQGALERPGPGLRRILKRGGWRRDRRSGPRELLRAAVKTLDAWRDHPTPWSRPPFDRDAEVEALLEALAALGGLAARAARRDDYLAKDLLAIEAWLAEQGARERVRGRDHDGLEAALRQLARRRSSRWKGGGKRYGEGLTRSEVLAQRDAVDARLARFVASCEADLAPLLREELTPVVHRYAELKRSAGRLDFLDLLTHTQALLRTSPSVREELQDRFTRIFVDEFQDTDPLQADILLLLAADDPSTIDPASLRVQPGKLFVVGDPKQSIYRFRRADVGTYREVARRLVEQGAERLHLTTSFRSVPGIQAAVNVAFAPWMSAGDDGVQSDYVPLEPWRPAPEGRPSVVALPVPRPYEAWGRPTKRAVQDSTPDAVAAFVHWLVTESGWTVRDPAGEPDAAEVPIAPRHVCLLFKRMQSWGQDVTRPYVRGLEARRVPHVLVGGRSFHEREEVVALHSVLRAIEWPDDELAVYATLRGPFLGFEDGTLLAYRQAVGTIHPLRPGDAPDDPALAPVADALELLAGLHRERNRRPVAETLQRFLVAVRAHAAVAIWPTGEQSLANVLHLLDDARRFESRRPSSFRGFVDQLADRAERGATGEAPTVEEGAEGVRIMTVHKAKGLEFPVVVLCDPTAPRTSERPSRFLDPGRGLWAGPIADCAPLELHEHRELVLRADEAEVIRTTYVAATRARDLLVVPAVGDASVEGWVDVLHRAVYPLGPGRREAEPAPGCPAFGGDSVLERSPKAEGSASTSVAPGHHRVADGVDVVWWDPHVLGLDVEPRGGVRQRELLVEDESGQARAHWTQAWHDWSAWKARALERGGSPTRRALAITAAAAQGSAALDDAAFGDERIRVERAVVSRAGRPRGKRFGSLVHAVLAAVPYAADRGRVEAVARAAARWSGAPDAEVDAAIEATLAALRHPLLERAAGAARCHRELPLSHRGDDGTLYEGVADLVFCETDGGAWTIVDFKTDAVESVDAYRAQLSMYKRSLENVRAADVELVLLEV